MRKDIVLFGSIIIGTKLLLIIFIDKMDYSVVLGPSAIVSPYVLKIYLRYLLIVSSQFLTFFLILRKFGSELKASWKDFRHNIKRNIPLTMLCFVMMFCLNFFISLVYSPPYKSNVDFLGEMKYYLPMILYFVYICIPIFMAPLIEEVLYRKIGMHLASGTTPVIFIRAIITSIIFGLMHLGSRGTIIATVPVMLIGLNFCFFYAISKNIYVAVFAHFMWNFLNSVGMWLQ